MKNKKLIIALIVGISIIKIVVVFSVIIKLTSLDSYYNLFKDYNENYTYGDDEYYNGDGDYEYDEDDDYDYEDQDEEDYEDYDEYDVEDEEEEDEDDSTSIFIID